MVRFCYLARLLRGIDVSTPLHRDRETCINQSSTTRILPVTGASPGRFTVNVVGTFTTEPFEPSLVHWCTATVGQETVVNPSC